MRTRASGGILNAPFSVAQGGERARAHSFFKRFNDENKRLKMRGVHVWVVEAVCPCPGDVHQPCPKRVDGVRPDAP